MHWANNDGQYHATTVSTGCTFETHNLKRTVLNTCMWIKLQNNNNNNNKK